MPLAGELVAYAGVRPGMRVLEPSAGTGSLIAPILAAGGDVDGDGYGEILTAPGPSPVFAAQVHQESAWRPDAVSHVGAQGLAQFMPATTRWIAGLNPNLAAQQPFNVAWSLRALVTYDRWLYDRAPAHYSPRDRMWVALRAYNGGLGHWQREAASTGLAQPSRAQVDAACGSTRRAAVHCKENLGYPHSILVVLQPRYLQWGPGL